MLYMDRPHVEITEQPRRLNTVPAYHVCWSQFLEAFQNKRRDLAIVEFRSVPYCDAENTSVPVTVLMSWHLLEPRITEPTDNKKPIKIGSPVIDMPDGLVSFVQWAAPWSEVIPDFFRKTS